MPHLYSRGCEYALRALQAMAEQPHRVSTVSKLCRRAEIPEHFTRKMLQPLVRAGILKSARGPGGGFTFSRQPEDIPLMEVVQAIESGSRFEFCILGMSRCDEENPCPLHHLWEPIKNSVQELLRERSVADLAAAPKIEGEPGAAAEMLISEAVREQVPQ